MKEEQIKRINELAYKKKIHGLTDAEQKEQKELYKFFVSDIKSQLKTQLDRAGFNNRDRS
jgi:uncharacterized protein YnzC (UPF0291/DUF896 family)